MYNVENISYRFLDIHDTYIECTYYNNAKIVSLNEKCY